MTRGTRRGIARLTVAALVAATNRAASDRNGSLPMHRITQSWRVATACLAVSLSLGLSAMGATPASAAFPGESGQIVFSSFRDGNGEIYVMNADGTGQTRLTTNTADDFDPAWSPDGARIAFHSDRDGNHEIYVMNADGTGQTRLTTNATGDFDPAWSPDGARIAFSSNRDGNDEIYVMNADGTGQTRLTTHTASDGQPVWSPDGARIAFSSFRDVTLEIYVINADGTGETRLTTNIGGFPAWSPDGTRIAMSSNREGTNEIYVMNADGTGQTRLTTNTAHDVEPAWSPDGVSIAFSSDRDGNREIYVMNADGTGQTRLTSSTAFDFEPDWQSIPAVSDSGTVNAVVTVPTSAACLELSTSAIEFGSVALGAVDAPAAPTIGVTNCSGSGGIVYARGTNASGPGAAWGLVDSPATCADTLGTDAYHLRLAGDGTVQLSTENKMLGSVASGVTTNQTARIDTACPGSTGAGTTMTFEILFLATEG